MKCVPLRKLNCTNAWNTAFISIEVLCPKRMYSSKGSLSLFFKFIWMMQTFIVLSRVGTEIALSELGVRSSPCNCDQSLRMVFRWRTRGLFAAPPPKGHATSCFSGCVLAQVGNSRQIPGPSNSWLTTKRLMVAYQNV